MTSGGRSIRAAVRHQAGVVKLLATAYHPAAFSRGLGLGWVSTPDGTEVDGVTEEQMDAYSSRKQAIDRETVRKCAEFEREHGRAPERARKCAHCASSPRPRRAKAKTMRQSTGTSWPRSGTRSTAGTWRGSR